MQSKEFEVKIINVLDEIEETKERLAKSSDPEERQVLKEKLIELQCTRLIHIYKLGKDIS
ncbi:MAG: hypothetical protein GX550_04275 [Syntrophomonadaceae bacterium]|jgi:hypothetical protein|nr:hypothetical protein [Syntrophomonadaceae bacterium]